MKKNTILVMIFILLFVSCNKTEVKTEQGNMVGAPYEVELDTRGKAAVIFIRETEKNLGEVTKYKRQIVAGVNHYFEFVNSGKPPIEVIVYEDLDGNYEIISKGILE